MEKSNDGAENVITEDTALMLLKVGGGIAVISAFLFLFFGSWKFHWYLDEAKIGQFGDFIGGVVGSLFSLVGVILFYIALKDQRTDFKTNQNALQLQITAANQQIEEFKAQREELESTRKIYEQQTKTMKNQQFDSNFYSLLNVFVNIKKNLNQSSDGEEYFQKKFQQLSEKLTYNQGDTLVKFREKIIDEYENIYLGDRANLSLYFKTVYRLLVTIEECDHLTESEKLFYSKVLRSQITNDELLILYYNYHSVYGKRVQRLILKYNFLKHLETLSKIEFEKKFTLSTKDKIDLILLTDMIGELLTKNLKIAEDIEITEPVKVEEKIDKYGWIIGIYIDQAIDLKIIVDKDQDTLLSLSREHFKDFIYTYLSDELFYNKFIVPQGSEISKSITTDDVHTVFSYTITLS